MADQTGDQHAVRLQLKWHHQFQFAGYYAAQAQGYYAQEGLNVHIVEGDAEHPPIQEVLAGRADFGVSDADVLQAYLRGKPVVVLAAIFQHSPYILMTRADSGLRTPTHLRGKTIMLSDEQGIAQLKAVFHREGMTLKDVQIIPHQWNNDLLINGKVDAISAYSTVEPFQLRAKGVEPGMIRAMDYGVDFYGDTLFTTRAEVKRRPDQVSAFRRASLRGWDYALAHPDEIIEQILKMPGVAERGLTPEMLHYEAHAMRELILPGLVDIGHMNPGRWQAIARIYANIGIIDRAPTEEQLQAFIYTTRETSHERWLMPLLAGLGILALIALAVLALNVQLRRSVARRTAELARERAFLEAVLEACPAGIIVAEPGGKLVRMNPANQRLWGLAPFSESVQEYEEWKGWWADDSPRRGRRLEPQEWALARALRGEVCPGDIVEIEPFGEPGIRRTMINSGAPVRGEQGQILGAVIVQIDITQLKGTESRLRESESRLRLAQRAGRIGVFDWFISEKRLVWSAGLEELFGLNEGSFENSFEAWVSRVLSEDAGNLVLGFDVAMAERRSTHSYEFRRLLPDGSWRWTSAHGQFYYDEQGLPLRMVGVNIDTHERKQAEEALGRNERRLRAFFESDMFGALYWTVEGGITEANGKLLQMLGVSREEFEKQPLRWTDITPPEYRAADEHSLSEIRARGVSTPYEKEFTRRNGSRIPVIIGAALVDEIGQEGVAFVLDNSERKRAEKAAAELRRKLDAGLLAGEVGIFDWDLLRDRFWGDPNFARFFDVDLDINSTVSIANLMAVIHPEDRSIVTQRIQRTIETGVPYEAEYRIIARNQTRWVIARAVAQRDDTGRAVRFPGVLVDITERKHTEQKLRASEERLRKAISTPTVGVLFFTLDGGILEANDAIQRMSGYRMEELRTFHWRTLTAPESWDVTATAAEELATRGETSPYEKQMVRKDGSRWWGLFAPVRLAGSGANSECMEFIVDTTARREAEEALRRRSLHLQLLHHAAARLLVGQDPVQLLRDLHKQIDDVFGADAFMLYKADPDNGHMHLLDCAGVSAEERRRLETLRYGRAVCAHPEEGLRPIISTHIQTREDPDRRFLRKLGFRSYLYYPLILNNRLHGTVAFASRQRDDYDRIDVEFFHTIAGTLAEALERERLQTELQRYATELERRVQQRTAKLSETIAELEGFSYSLVHDMRAPLRAMLSYASFLEEEMGPRLRAEESDFLRKIKLASKRMDQLITDSLNYSRVLRENLPLGAVDLGNLLKGMVETYPNLQPPGADIRVEVSNVRVTGNEAGLTQVFSNLLGNAVKFVAPGIKPKVRVWAQELDSRGASGGEETAAADPQGQVRKVLIWVEDNGIGIPREAQDKIFGMFHRLHRADDYPGTGIGLAIARKSLDRMGGRICLDSEPGKGSRFCVEVPLAP